ncbi:hypothetical protein PTI98_002571 [Pleurotus ostreatus]|nr:hypothetical protein PTI98_002571 [Pleurotus ostreatus]
MVTLISAILVWFLALRATFGVRFTMAGANATDSLGLSRTRKDPFWLEAIKHQGIAPFHPNASQYPVFRNVKDYGAKGDGVADDTEAINLALSSGDRCGEGTCPSSTVSPALVYFPAGKYVISRPIIAWYYSQLIGDAKQPPTLLAAASFEGMAVIDADPYIPGGGGRQWYINQNNFFRSVRNFIIDLRRMPSSASATGLHWQVSQATSLMNIVVQMSTKRNTGHQGIWMENGSGGYMGDLTFNGGKYGIWGGNQQFTVRNVVFNDVQTAVYGVWNWGWTFQGVSINNCQIGFDLQIGGTKAAAQGVGSEAIIDVEVRDTPIFIRTSVSSQGQLRGSLVLNNIELNNVKTAVGVASGEVLLQGGKHKIIDTWAQGNIYSTSVYHKFVQAEVASPYKPASLLDKHGRIVSKMHPQYEDISADRFLSARDHGCKGDGHTDETQALQTLLNKAANENKLVFIDAGVYVITDTLKVPAGSRVVGEAWSVISGKGKNFQDPNEPRVMVQVGGKGSIGTVEITDIMFSTIGPAGGAIVIEWNIRDPVGRPASCGMWDSHIRLGGAAGTDLDFAHCPKGSADDACMAAFLALHLTRHCSAYLEGTWVWLADHDLDVLEEDQITLFSGRGILSESQGPVWMIGTAEHHVLYQYNLYEAKDHYMGLIQTESPYFQPTPAAPHPFPPSEKYNDPSFESLTSSWALYVQKSQRITIFGAGLYSFFNNYSQACLDTKTCQSQIANIDTSTSVRIYGLSTVGATFQLSINHVGLINQADNQNGFQETATAFLTEP